MQSLSSSCRSFVTLFLAVRFRLFICINRTSISFLLSTLLSPESSFLSVSSVTSALSVSEAITPNSKFKPQNKHQLIPGKTSGPLLLFWYFLHHSPLFPYWSTECHAAFKVFNFHQLIPFCPFVVAQMFGSNYGKLFEKQTRLIGQAKKTNPPNGNVARKSYSLHKKVQFHVIIVRFTFACAMTNWKTYLSSRARNTRSVTVFLTT